jgi:hypothetical protein
VVRDPCAASSRFLADQRRTSQAPPDDGLLTRFIVTLGRCLARAVAGEWIRAPRCSIASPRGVGPLAGPSRRGRGARATVPTWRPAQSVAGFGLLVAIGLASPAPTSAEVERVVVESRAQVLDGKSFGPAGAYEKLSGTIAFGFDPANRANARIVDLDRAPRNAAGRVEATANFMALRPKDRGKGRDVVLVEVSNRGGKASLLYFNGATPTGDPMDAAHFGDEFLMRQGLTVVWVGWQFDVPREEDALRLVVPVATDGGRPIEGIVRSDWTVDRSVTTLPLGHRRHTPYRPVESRDGEAVLTVRDGRLAPRRIVPRDQWRFARASGGRLVADREHIAMENGFQAGKIYELVYHAQDPVVVGLGLAAIRDVVTYAKYDDRAVFPARTGIAFGVSQTGRFLRHFLYQGFNTDERGRRAFDGMLIHAAGAGRGSFNHRFGQPSRDAHRYSAFFYPTDLFPFTSRPQRDPDTGITDGLLSPATSPDQVPKIFYTNSGYEYWGRAGSLIHTTLDGSADVDPLASERVYHLAGGQHFVVGFPPPSEARLEGSRAFRGNPLDYLVTLRALLVRLVEWVADGVTPPPSAIPTIGAGTLVSADRLNFPTIPGVAIPSAAHEAYRVDYGPRWPEGIVTIEPPRLGRPFPSMVSRVDAAGNEVGGLQAIELRVPLATYAPWSLRVDFPGGADELLDFYGTYIPFPRTEAERETLRDPRPSIQSLYRGKEHYMGLVGQAANALVAEGLLLPEDVPRVRDRAARHWDWITKACAC